MIESRIEKLTRIGQEMAAAVAEMNAEAVDLTPDLTTELAIRQIEGEAAWWRSVDFDRNASRTFESMTGDSQQAVRTGVERVLAYLQSTGRLVPAGGMALTAEQVEDLRTAREGLRGYRNFDGNARGRVNRLIAAVDALFPATEPAEETAAEHVERTRRFQSTTLPAPAEPAEEETKAERDSEGIIRINGGRIVALSCDTREMVQRWFDIAKPGSKWQRDYAAALDLFDREAASSPVVPAPTETGPWHTWQEVPDGVQYYGINGWGTTYYVNRDGVRHRVFDDTPSKTADHIVQGSAPFVAAEEG